MRLAIVHDYLTQRGGAERVVLAMTRAFPEAPVFTSLYDPDGTFAEFQDVDVRVSWLDHVAPLRKRHRLALPLYPLVFSRMRVPAEVVLCSSSGWAHGVANEGSKIVYCHNPARWLYQREDYLGSGAGVPARALRVLRRPLQAWDRRAASTATKYLANSSVVATRINDVYGRDAEVVPPPPALTPGGPNRPVEGVTGGFLLCVSRLLPYKNVDAVIEAMGQLPDQQLVIVGDGPLLRELSATAPANVHLIGKTSDPELRWLYECCTGLVAASFEDYGLTPLEAASFGKPCAVLRGGGYLDTMTDETAVFFDAPTPRLITEAVRELATRGFDPAAIRARAQQFDEAHFIRSLRELVEREASAGPAA